MIDCIVQSKEVHEYQGVVVGHTARDPALLEVGELEVQLVEVTAVVHFDMESAAARHMRPALEDSLLAAVVRVVLEEDAACIAMWHSTSTWLYRMVERLRWSSFDCDPEEALPRRYWRMLHLVVRSKQTQSSEALHDCNRDPAEPGIEPCRDP
jgi:hypothetical protein